MTEVKFYKGSYGFEKVTVQGHAEYNTGNDIVCAGISALAQALVGTLQNVDGISFKKKKVEPGNIELEIEPFFDEYQKSIDSIFFTVYIGLSQIEKSYPKNIKVALIRI